MGGSRFVYVVFVIPLCCIVRKSNVQEADHRQVIHITTDAWSPPPTPTPTQPLALPAPSPFKPMLDQDDKRASKRHQAVYTTRHSVQHVFCELAQQHLHVLASHVVFSPSLVLGMQLLCVRAGATSLAANPLTSQVADSMQGMATIAFNHSGQQKLSRIQEYAANPDRAVEPFLSDEHPLALCSFAAPNSVIIKGLQVLRTLPHIIQAGCLKNTVMEVEPQAGM